MLHARIRNLVLARPDFYKAVASFGGYPTASSPGFPQCVSVAVGEMGGNARNDPSLHEAWFETFAPAFGG